MSNYALIFTLCYVMGHFSLALSFYIYFYVLIKILVSIESNAKQALELKIYHINHRIRASIENNGTPKFKNHSTVFHIN